MYDRLRLFFLSALSCASMPLLAGLGVWTTGGPWGGAVTCVAIDPEDGTRLFAATSGGFYRSTDGAATWFLSPDGPLSARALTVDPSDPATIYAGTSWGEVFKSTDSGASWTSTTAGLTDPGRSAYEIAAIAVDPFNRSRLYLVAAGGAFQSVDGGARWSALPLQRSSIFDAFYGIAVDPGDPATLWVASETGVRKSTDHGDSWTTAGKLSRTRVVAPLPGRDVYAATCVGVFHSTDAGLTWSAAGLTNLEVAAFAVDPRAPRTLHALAFGGPDYACLSTDSGATWTRTRTPFDTSRSFLVLDPSSEGTVYTPSFEGVWKSNDSGMQWVDASFGIAARETKAAVFDPSAASNAYASGGSHVFRTSDSGRTWSVAAGNTNSFEHLVACPGPPVTLLGASSGVSRSTDGGETWATVSSAGYYDVSDLVVAPQPRSVVYSAVEADGVHRSTDSGATWELRGRPPASLLAVDPADASTLYAWSWNGLRKSTDAGATWTPSANVFPGVHIRAIRVDPGDSRVVCAAGIASGVSGGFFRSTDAGSTWARAGELSTTDVFAMVADPSRAGTLYVQAAGKGFLASRDSGETWSALNAGLPWALNKVPAAQSLAVDSGGKSLLVAFSANGIWQLTILPPGFYVAPSGNDTADGGPFAPWVTIQHAAEAALPGSTVYVRGGTYREKVLVTRSGTPGAWLTFSAFPGENPVIDASGIRVGGGELEGAFSIHDAAYVRVSGLTVKNVGPGSQDCGFLVEDSHDVVLERNVTDDTASSGIGVWGSADVTLDGNEVIRACHGGIQEQISVAGTTRFLVTNNLVHDAGGTPLGGEGICLKDGSSAGRVRGNTVWNVPERVGIYVDAWDEHTFDIELDSNLVHDCLDGIGLASEMGGLLEAIRVTNNVAYDNGHRGLFVADFGGVAMHPMNDLLIANNTFVGNGTRGWGGGIAVDDPGARGVVVRNNIVAKSPSFSIIVAPALPPGAVAVDHDLIDLFHGDLAEGETRGTDGLEADPRFENAASHDFRLLADSPAIDRGSSDRAPSADFDGAPRPRGAAVDIGAFEHADIGASVTLFVPAIVRTAGLAGSFFTSELTLTNRGARSARVALAYTGTDGTTGSAEDRIEAGRQMIVPDAIAWLASFGIPMPSSTVGTLRVTFFGVEDARDAAVLVRTTTPVPPAAPVGSAGLAYTGVRLTDLPRGAVLLAGLRDDAHDRSNVAMQNAGAAEDGEVMLRATLLSDVAVVATKDVTLAPGGFSQFAVPAGFRGVARVERIAGRAPFYAYGVINDAANSDGSFIAPLPEASIGGTAGITLPVVVETSVFTTEVVLLNTSGVAKRVRLALHADGIASAGAAMTLNLPAGAQVSIPGFVAALRAAGASVPSPVVGPLLVTVDGGTTAGLFAGARTGNDGGGGRYTLFSAGVPVGSASTNPVFLNGLKQTATTRTNLALVNTGESGDGADTFLVEVFDGATGSKAGERRVTVGAQRQLQINTVLSDVAPGTTNGWARVTRTSGTNPFVAYAVLNDGASPGERSGDGAWVTSQ